MLWIESADVALGLPQDTRDRCRGHQEAHLATKKHEIQPTNHGSAALLMHRQLADRQNVRHPMDRARVLQSQLGPKGSWVGQLPNHVPSRRRQELGKRVRKGRGNVQADHDRAQKRAARLRNKSRQDRQRRRRSRLHADSRRPRPHQRHNRGRNQRFGEKRQREQGKIYPRQTWRLSPHQRQKTDRQYPSRRDLGRHDQNNQKSRNHRQASRSAPKSVSGQLQRRRLCPDRSPPPGVRPNPTWLPPHRKG